MNERRAAAASLAASVFAGAALRLWHLRGQVMGDDELHAVRVVARQAVPEILTTYRLADVSLPLAALSRFLMERGVVLSELDFRLPALLCGLIALVAVPRAFQGKLERVEVELLGWLVAFSPVLVLYSRIARSYMPMVLAGFGAVMVFELWWRTRRWRAGLAYVLLAALAVWLHLGTATLVASPFLFALGDLVPPRREGRWRGFAGLVALGSGLAAACALFLGPARDSLVRVIAAKRQEQAVPLSTVLEVLHLQAGTGRHLVAAVFWTAALAGLVLLLRDRPRLGLYTLTVVAGHVGGLVLLAPVGWAIPLALNRYLLPVLPFVLVWVAYALGRPWTAQGGCSGALAQRFAARIFVLALIWTGPFVEPGFRQSSFMHHNDFLRFTVPRAALPARAVPGFYRQLAALPRGAIVEYPWPMAWGFNRAFYTYQRIHGRRVLVSAPFDVPRHPRIDLRNEIAPEPEDLLASPARYAIIHLRLSREEDRISPPPGGRRMDPKLRRRYRQAGLGLARRLTREWGEPDYADELVEAWDLERLRRR